MTNDDTTRSWLGDDIKQWREGIRNGYSRAYIIHALLETGVFEAIRRAGPDGKPCDGIAKECDLDGFFLDAVLNYLAFSDEVIEKTGQNFRLGKHGEWLFDPALSQSLLTYISAYGCLMQELMPALKREKRYGKDFVRDGQALARASFGATKQNYPFVVSEMKRLGVRNIADLGCGAAGVLMAFCELDPDVRGVGIDLSPGAIEEATQRVKKAKLDHRIKLALGDITRPETFMDLPALRDVEAFNCIGVIHEFLRDGEEAVVSIFRRLKERFPGRYFFLGEFNAKSDDEFRAEAIPNRIRNMWYQFLMHPLSLQGIPMPRERWLALFERAGVEFVTVKDFYLDQYVLRL